MPVTAPPVSDERVFGLLRRLELRPRHIFLPRKQSVCVSCLDVKPTENGKSPQCHNKKFLMQCSPHVWSMVRAGCGEYKADELGVDAAPQEVVARATGPLHSS